jgi:hypothetical protein
LQSENTPDGLAYVEDFINDESKPADLVYELGGGTSVTAGSGYNFHFYPTSRATVDRSEMARVLVTFQARLIGVGDNETMPKYLAGAGCDLWRDLEADWLPDYSNNSDIGIGRLKYVTPEWQYFTMHDFSAEELVNLRLPEE